MSDFTSMYTKTMQEASQLANKCPNSSLVSNINLHITATSVYMAGTIQVLFDPREQTGH